MFAVCNIRQQCVYYEMAKLNSEKQKYYIILYYALMKKKSLVRLAPEDLKSPVGTWRINSANFEL